MKAISYQNGWSSNDNTASTMVDKFGMRLVYADYSEQYDTNESALFFAKDGTYNWLDANGCSCWDGDWDGWNLTKEELLTLAKKRMESSWNQAETEVANWVIENVR